MLEPDRTAISLGLTQVGALGIVTGSLVLIVLIAGRVGPRGRRAPVPMVLMFLGRVGPPSLGIALVLRERDRRCSHPDERPLVG